MNAKRKIAVGAIGLTALAIGGSLVTAPAQAATTQTSTTQSAPDLADPVISQITPADHGGTVTWTYRLGQMAYRVDAQSTNGQTTLLAQGTGPTTSASFAGLTNGETYQVTVHVYIPDHEFVTPAVSLTPEGAPAPTPTPTPTPTPAPPTPVTPNSVTPRGQTAHVHLPHHVKAHGSTVILKRTTSTSSGQHIRVTAKGAKVVKGKHGSVIIKTNRHRHAKVTVILWTPGNGTFSPYKVVKTYRVS